MKHVHLFYNDPKAQLTVLEVQRHLDIRSSRYLYKVSGY